MLPTLTYRFIILIGYEPGFALRLDRYLWTKSTYEDTTYASRTHPTNAPYERTYERTYKRTHERTLRTRPSNAHVRINITRKRHVRRSTQSDNTPSHHRYGRQNKHHLHVQTACPNPHSEELADVLRRSWAMAHIKRPVLHMPTHREGILRN